MALMIIDVEGAVAGDVLAQLFASAPTSNASGTVSMRFGRMSVLLTAEEATEFHRELGNALAVAQGLVKIPDGISHAQKEPKS